MISDQLTHNTLYYLIYIPFAVALLIHIFVRPIMIAWKENDLSPIESFLVSLIDETSYIPILSWITTLGIGFKLLSFNTLFSDVTAASLLAIFILLLTSRKPSKSF